MNERIGQLNPDDLFKEKLKPISINQIGVSLQEYLDKHGSRGEVWKKPEFQLIDALHSRRGPFIEIGGPTEIGYGILDFSDLNKKIHTSNVYPGVKLFDDNGPAGMYGKVNFQADGRRLPMGDKVAGAIFSAHLGVINDESYPVKDLSFYNNKSISEANWKLRSGVIEEAWRVLEPGGLFIYKHGFKEDLEFAQQVGFKTVQYVRECLNSRNPDDCIYIVVFEKPLEKNE